MIYGVIYDHMSSTQQWMSSKFSLLTEFFRLEFGLSRTRTIKVEILVEGLRVHLETGRNFSLVEWSIFSHFNSFSPRLKVINIFTWVGWDYSLLSANRYWIKVKLRQERKSKSNIQAKTWSHSSLKNVRKWALKSFSSETEFSVAYEHLPPLGSLDLKCIPLFPLHWWISKNTDLSRLHFLDICVKRHPAEFGQREGLAGPGGVSDTAASTRLASLVPRSSEDLDSLALEIILPLLVPPA